jgi:hypothetical protein
VLLSSYFLSVAVAASPVPNDAVFPAINTATSNTPFVCVGAEFSRQNLIVAFLFRRNAASYVRVAALPVQRVDRADLCPETEFAVTLPPLEAEARYVVGFYGAPLSSGKDLQSSATGSTRLVQLVPLSYLGIAVAK